MIALKLMANKWLRYVRRGNMLDSELKQNQDNTYTKKYQNYVNWSYG